jgi:hypothetical protein
MKTLGQSRLSGTQLSKRIRETPEIDVPVSISDYVNTAMSEVSVNATIDILPQPKKELPKLQTKENMFANSEAMKKLLKAMANTKPNK